MTADASAGAAKPEQEYLRIWAEAASKVLEQLYGSALMATPLPDSTAPAAEPSSPTIWISWKVAGKISGEQSFQLEISDAVRLSQMLMQEPADAGATLDEVHADALKEIFRQFAGLAASACKAKYGQEITFDLAGSARPEWTPAFQQSWVFASPQLSPVHWTVFLDTSLVTAVMAAAAPQPASPPVPSPASASAQSAKASAVASNPMVSAAAVAAAPAAGLTAAATNLDMLLDVELEAVLRFGQREMLLRDILGLRPGSVIELNRNISEPAELLVGGRVVARGDVVIVDGSYGLRITEIEHPRQRLGSIET